MTFDMHGRIDNDLGFHAATDITHPLHEEVRKHFRELAHWVVDNTPPSREQSLALTAIQEACMWSNAAVACNLAPLEVS